MARIRYMKSIETHACAFLALIILGIGRVRTHWLETTEILIKFMIIYQYPSEPLCYALVCASSVPEHTG